MLVKNLSNSGLVASGLVRRLKQILQPIVVLIVIIFVGLYLQEQWIQVREETVDIRWGYVVLAYIGMATGLLLLPWASWLTLKHLTVPLPRRQVWRIFFVSNVGKYLPGSIWALPGRALFYQNAGLPGRYSLVAVFWEVVLMVISASLLALLSLRIIAHYLDDLFMPTVVAGSIVLLGIFVVVRSNLVPLLMARLPLPGLLRQLGKDQHLMLSVREVGSVVSIYVLAWAVIGLSFGALVYGFTVTASLVDFVELAGIYMGSWVVGFLVIVAPSGIGVRDGLIALGLATMVSDPLPAVIAIAARIVWTVAEVSGLLLVLALTTSHVVDTSPGDTSLDSSIGQEETYS